MSDPQRERERRERLEQAQQRGREHADWADAAAERGRRMREEGAQMRETAKSAHLPLQNIPRPTRAEGEPEPTCPRCGSVLVEGSGCNACFGGSEEDAETDFGAAEGKWAAAEFARDAAARDHRAAAATWREANAEHSRAARTWEEAQQTWEESQVTSAQAEIDWESAQTRWQRAQERELADERPRPPDGGLPEQSGRVP